MTKVKNFINSNKKILILVVALLIILLTLGIYFVTFRTNDNKESTTSQTKEKVEKQNVKVEDIKSLEEKGVITGIKNMKLQKGTEVNLEDLVVINKDYVKNVVVDDSKIDYNKDGEYEVIYTITFDGEKLQKFLKNENVKVTFNTKSSTIIIKVPITVTVIDEKNAKEETEKGNEIITNDTKDKIVEENKNKSISNGNTSAVTGGNSDSGSSKTLNQHTHIWVDHATTKQVWIENFVDVPDYEMQTIYGARFYTVNKDGSFNANGPTYWFENGFTQDDLKEIIYNALKNGDDGVLNGVYYGNYQNVTKTKQVQVGSHKEDHGFYQNESYVDYQYCSICGATQE